MQETRNWALTFRKSERCFIQGETLNAKLRNVRETHCTYIPRRKSYKLQRGWNNNEVASVFGIGIRTYHRWARLRSGGGRLYQGGRWAHSGPSGTSRSMDDTGCSNCPLPSAYPTHTGLSACLSLATGYRSGTGSGCRWRRPWRSRRGRRACCGARCTCAQPSARTAGTATGPAPQAPTTCRGSWTPPCRGRWRRGGCRSRCAPPEEAGSCCSRKTEESFATPSESSCLKRVEETAVENKLSVGNFPLRLACVGKTQVDWSVGDQLVELVISTVLRSATDFQIFFWTLYRPKYCKWQVRTGIAQSGAAHIIVIVAASFHWCENFS